VAQKGDRIFNGLREHSYDLEAAHTVRPHDDGIMMRSFECCRRAIDRCAVERTITLCAEGDVQFLWKIASFW